MKRLMEIIDRITAAQVELRVIWNEQESGYQFAEFVYIICDRSDVERIKAETWFALKDSHGNATLYKNSGTDANPHYLCMTNWLLGLDNNVFVEHMSGNTADFRRSNLRRA